MPKISAGILVYRIKEGQAQFLLVHPGGPFFRNKDKGAWTVPKGLADDDEHLLDAAKREFEEETGIRAPEGEYISLGSVKQKGGKVVHVWAAEADIAIGKIKSNTFELEWPPKSGKKQLFPEIDRAAYYGYDLACEKIIPEQKELIDRLCGYLKLNNEIV